LNCNGAAIKLKCAIARILATECIVAPEMASNLFIEVANASALCIYLGALFCFAATVLFCVLLCEVFAGEDVEALAPLFTFDPVFAPAFERVLAPARALLVRT